MHTLSTTTVFEGYNLRRVCPYRVYNFVLVGPLFSLVLKLDLNV